ncbi:MAG: DegV family protein [Oscillospiraceae bacterium]|nr:DegV family protein [Oscillospiraceae bacterium]
MLRIITDSASDFIPGEREDISVLPLSIIFGSEEFKDGLDLSRDDFYKRLAASRELPKTSQVTPYEFESEYKKVRQAGDEALVVTLSSKLSGTYSAAVTAAAKYPEIKVVDSESVSISENLLVRLAVRLAAEGKGAEAAAGELEAARERLNVVALFDTLEYLKKGGRLSSAATVAGTLMGFKPLMTMKDGKVAALGKARGYNRGSGHINRLVRERGEIDFENPPVLGYTGLDDKRLKEYLAASEELLEGRGDELPIVRIGCTIGTHAGPGAVAVAWFSK